MPENRTGFERPPEDWKSRPAKYTASQQSALQPISQYPRSSVRSYEPEYEPPQEPAETKSPSLVGPGILLFLGLFNPIFLLFAMLAYAVQLPDQQKQQTTRPQYQPEYNNYQHQQNFARSEPEPYPMGLEEEDNEIDMDEDEEFDDEDELEAEEEQAKGEAHAQQSTITSVPPVGISSMSPPVSAASPGSPTASSGSPTANSGTPVISSTPAIASSTSTTVTSSTSSPLTSVFGATPTSTLPRAASTTSTSTTKATTVTSLTTPTSTNTSSGSSRVSAAGSLAAVASADLATSSTISLVSAEAPHTILTDVPDATQDTLDTLDTLATTTPNSSASASSSPSSSTPSLVTPASPVSSTLYEYNDSSNYPVYENWHQSAVITYSEDEDSGKGVSDDDNDFSDEDNISQDSNNSFAMTADPVLSASSTTASTSTARSVTPIPSEMATGVIIGPLTESPPQPRQATPTTQLTPSSTAQATSSTSSTSSLSSSLSPTKPAAASMGVAPVSAKSNPPSKPATFKDQLKELTTGYIIVDRLSNTQLENLRKEISGQNIYNENPLFKDIKQLSLALKAAEDEICKHKGGAQAGDSELLTNADLLKEIKKQPELAVNRLNETRHTEGMMDRKNIQNDIVLAGDRFLHKKDPNIGSIAKKLQDDMKGQKDKLTHDDNRTWRDKVNKMNNQTEGLQGKGLTY